MKKIVEIICVSALLIILLHPEASCEVSSVNVCNNQGERRESTAVFHPESFGALGDGHSDDSNAINEAIQKASEYSGIVKLDGTKTYYCKSAMQLRSDVTVDLNGCRLIVRTVKLFDNDNPTLGYNGYHDIVIQNGIFETTNSVAIAHARNIIIKDCIFLKCAGNHFIEMCASQHVFIENCSFLGQSTESGVREMIQLDVCEPTSFKHYSDVNNPSYDYTPLDDINIEDCYFAAYITSQKKIPLHSAIGGHVCNPTQNTNLSICNCVIVGSDGNGIVINNWNRVLIENCTLKNISNQPIGLRYECNDVTVKKNTIEAFEEYAITTYGRDFECSKIQIIGNQVISGGALFNIKNCNDLIVSNNICCS